MAISLPPGRRPLGERDNNPCNLEDAGIPWHGMTDTYGKYCIFDTPENGIRAGARDIHTKWKIHRLRNVASIITVYAPPDDNDTVAYITAVCKELVIGPHDFIDLDDVHELARFVTAVIRHECGRVIYDAAMIEKACNEALNHAA